MSVLPINEQTFETFIKDKSNRFAIAVCHAMVAETKTFNPLILYGKSGCGKTHLLMAIKNACSNKPNKPSVGMFTIEDIILDYINQPEIQKGNSPTILFGQKCFEYDVILIEGLEYLRGREASQEEIFYLVNNLISKNKRVVITSLENPKSLKVFSKLLIERNESTLFCDIDKPSYDLKVKYCRMLAEKFDLNLNEEMIVSIANKFEKLSAIHGEVMTLKFLENKNNF